MRLRIKDILLSPHPGLSKPCRRVVVWGYSLEKKARALVETMQTNNAASLTAPQINSRLRMFAIKISSDSILMVNPVLLKAPSNLDNVIESQETCFSLPGRLFKVSRYDNISVGWQGLDRKFYSTWLKDRESKAWQHGIDHLQGMLLSSNLEAAEICNG